MHSRPSPAELPDTRDAHRQAIGRVSDIPPEYVAAALARLDSLPDGDRLLHGDFHPANVMLAADGPVIIDWSNATRGTPEADFARSDLMLRLGDPPDSMPWLIRFGAKFARSLMIGTYNRAYRKARPVDEALLRAWRLPVAVARISEGIATERPKLLKLIPELIARDA
jgi:aminoglycoside phosphotransferase (APT) family kinase protein